MYFVGKAANEIAPFVPYFLLTRTKNSFHIITRHCSAKIATIAAIT